MTDTPDDRSHRSVAQDTGRAIRFIVVAALVAVVVAVALDNRSEVRLGYVIGDGTAPIWLVIVAAAVAGAIIGWATSHRPRR